MVSRSTFFLIITAFHSFIKFASAEYNYYIDDSCDGKKKDFVQQAMVAAIDRAERALAAKQSPDEMTKKLMRQLFGNDDAKVQGFITTTFQYIPRLKEIDNPITLHKNDIRIYCDKSRLKVKPLNPFKVYDPDIQMEFPLTTKWKCAGLLMYTQYPSDQRRNSVLTPQYDQIQICPWFLDFAMQQTTRFDEDIELANRAKVAEKLNQVLKDRTIIYTPVDYYVLFEKVMLHELTHTFIADMKDDVGGSDGYGWKNCRKLSNVVTNQDDGVEGPDRNADTFALFASICKLQSQGLEINDDGTFVDPLNPTKKRAEVSWTA